MEKRTIIYPIVSEKATGQANTSKKYHFRVETSTNKIEIKKAIEKRFGVKVKHVHTLNVRGKKRIQHTKKGRIAGKKNDWKKAIVTLKDGYNLDIYTTPE